MSGAGASGRGTLTIVGMGPGDPELVTVRAARRIARATLVVHVGKRGASGHARRIASEYMPPGVDELRLDYPFTTEVAVDDPAYRLGIDRFHDEAASSLAGRLDGGDAVVLLCEGDPFLYGSSMHLFDRLRRRFPVEVVPGISAMSGAWSEAACPIAHGDDMLSVVPGTLDDAGLDAALGAAQAAVVMKLGRNLPRVRASLERLGLLDRAVYVENATAPEGRSMKLAERDPDLPAPYFSLLLIPGRRGPR